MYFDHTLTPAHARHGALTVPYLVCASPRSGSSLLCELLFRTGVAGTPTEYFDPEHMERFRSEWSVDGLDTYVDEVVARTTSPNGVLGMKAHFHQMHELFGDHGLVARLPGLRPIHITRSDRTAQAISYSIAVQTERWASTHDGNGSRPRFRRRQIDELAGRIEDDERRWREWLDALDRDHLTVRYEDLVADTTTELNRVLTFLGLRDAVAAHAPAVTLRRQRSARSRRWGTRYLAGERLRRALRR